MCRNGKEWVTDGVMSLQGWNGGVSISRGVSITLHHNNTWDLMGGMPIRYGFLELAAVQ